jgi:hypothetical protein
MTKHLSMVVLVVIALSGLPASAESAIEREAQDRAQIEKLMWQCVRALDTQNADAYAAVYAPDGHFGRGANLVKGREALKKMVNDLRQRAADAKPKAARRGRPCIMCSPTRISNSSIRITPACRLIG